MKETEKKPCPQCGDPINWKGINFHFREVHHIKWSEWRDAHNSNLVHESRLSASFVQQTLGELRAQLKTLTVTRDEHTARCNAQIAIVTADIRCLEKALELTAAPRPPPVAAPDPRDYMMKKLLDIPPTPPVATTLPTPIHPIPQDDPHNLLLKTEPAPPQPGKPRKKPVRGHIRSPYKAIGQADYKGRTFYMHDKPFDRMLTEIATHPVGEPFNSDCIRKIVIEMEPRNHECHAQAYLRYLVRHGYIETNGCGGSHRRYSRAAPSAPAGQTKLGASAAGGGT